MKTAYLNAELKEPIYLEPPAGLGEKPRKVWVIHRAVYGLGASGHLWWQLFTRKNRELPGMVPATDDDCVFIVLCRESVLVIAIVVDDILQATNDEQLQMK